MKIGFIEDTTLRGGTQIWVTEAAQNFIDQGEDVAVLTPQGSHVATLCEEAGASVFTYDWDDIEKNPAAYEQIWIDGLSNMDVVVCTVHPPRGDFHCTAFAAHCIKKAGLSTILIPKTGSIVPWYKREYYIPDPNVNTHVISITNFTRDYLIEEYKIPAEKVELIYQGTDINRFQSSEETQKEALTRYVLPDGAGPILGSIGALENRKGQILLLQSVRRLLDANRLTNIHVMFVGEGPDEEMLRAATKAYHLENHVSFFPFTREPNYVFERIDILALPSFYKEGLPNVILEAMSMQLPVISTDLAGIPEVVINGETGYLTDPANIEQFTDAIEKLWESKETCERMGRNARKLMQDTMDKSKQFDVFRSFFHKLIA